MAETQQDAEQKVTVFKYIWGASPEFVLFVLLYTDIDKFYKQNIRSA